MVEHKLINSNISSCSDATLSLSPAVFFLFFIYPFNNLYFVSLLSFLFLTHFVHLFPSQILLMLLHLMNIFLFFQSSLKHFFSFISLMDALFCQFSLSFSPCHSSAIHWSFFCSFSVSSGGVSWEGQLIYGPKKGTTSQSNAVSGLLFVPFSSWLIKLTPKIH